MIFGKSAEMMISDALDQVDRVQRMDPPGTGYVLRHSFYENGHARQTCVACGCGLADMNGPCQPFSARVLR